MKPYLFHFVCLFTITMTTAQQPIVVIDPGHGGGDPGAIGTNGIPEKEVVLGIAVQCLQLNRDLFGGRLDIYLTRYRDTLVSLSDRARLAQRLRADAFVSIHCNHSPNEQARGFEIYLSNKGTDGRSHALAHCLAERLQYRLGLQKRGIKYANFQVLRETHGHCPSILLETGFLSNAVEADHIQKTEGRTAMALALLQALIKTLCHD